MSQPTVEVDGITADEQETFLQAGETHPRGVSAFRVVSGLGAAVAIGAVLMLGSRRGQEMASSAAALVGLDAPPAPSDCKEHGEDCSTVKCCKQDGMQCFEKNEDLAVCEATCEPGVHPGEDNKGWTCAVLTPPAPDAPPPTLNPPPPMSKNGKACMGRDVDCSDSKCCNEPEAKCFQKNKWWATCMKQCDPGVHEGDDDGKPWTCTALLPEMDTTTKHPSGPPSTTEVPTPPVHCDGGPIPAIPQFGGYLGAPMMIKVLTYNLYWWNLFGVRKGNGNSAGLLIQATNSPLPWDLMGFQECEDGHRVIAGANLLGQMQVYQFQPSTKTSAICMAHRRAAFNLVNQGGEFVAEDAKQQYYGKRAIQWQRLQHRASGKFVFFANHHGPLTVNSGGKCGGAITGQHILRVLAANAKPGDAIILTGDFNAEPGSETLKVISQRLTDFVPAGIDNIYSNLAPGSLVRNMDIGTGGSDHHARLAVFQLTAPGGGFQNFV